MVGVIRARTACIAGLAAIAATACGGPSSSGGAPSSGAATPTASNGSATPTPSPTNSLTTTTFPELEGTWALTFTVTGFKGPSSASQAAYPLGSVQKLPWNFDTTCSPQTCEAFGESSPLPIPGESTSFSPVGVFTLILMASTPLVSTGGGPYTGQYPGSFGCGTEEVSLTVTATVARPDGPHATALTGTDAPVAGGNCPGVQYVVMKVTGSQITDATPQA
jgi:hypothetical protein